MDELLTHQVMTLRMVVAVAIASGIPADKLAESVPDLVTLNEYIRQVGEELDKTSAKE